MFIFKPKSIRSKLLLNGLSTILLSFFIVAFLVHSGLRNLSSQFFSLNDQRAEAIKKNLQETSDQNILNIRQMYETALEKKGRALMQKDSTTVGPMMEDNAFGSLRNLLEKNLRDDPEIIVATFFVEEDHHFKAWQYVSEAYPEGLNIPIEYDTGAKSWVAMAPQGIQVKVEDFSIPEVATRNTLSLTLKDFELPDAHGNKRKVKAYEGVIPLYKKNASGTVIEEARKKGETIGYLRYVLSLEEMEKKITAEKQKLETALSKQQNENEAAAEKSRSLAGRTLAQIYLFLVLGFAAVIGLAYLLSRASSDRLSKPVMALTEVAESMAGGNYRQEIKVQSDDEIGILAESFRNMSVAILKRDEELAAINKNLERLVEERTSQLAEQLRNIANLLNNMKQVVFTISSDGVIVPPVSKHAEEVFEMELAGKNVYETVYRNYDKTTEVYSAVHTALTTVIGESELQWDLMEGNLPRQLNCQVGSQEKILKVAYNPIWDDQGNLGKVMLVIEDITEVLALEKKIEAEKAESARKIQMIQELASSETEELRDFFTGQNKLIAELQECTVHVDDTEKQKVILRNLHTVKGNSRLFNLSAISNVTHQVETTVIAILNDFTQGAKTKESALSEILSAVAPVQSQVLEYGKLAKNIFGIENEVEAKLVAKLHASLKIEKAASSVDNKRQLLLAAQSLGEEKLVAELATKDWSRVSTEIKNIVLKSSLYAPYSRSPEAWVPVFSGYYDLMCAFSEWQSHGDEKLKALFGQKAHQLLSHCSAHQFEFLSQVLHWIELSLGMGEVPETFNAENSEKKRTQIALYLRWVMEYLKLVARLNSSHGLPRDQRARLEQVLSQIPDSIEGAREVLEKSSRGDSVLVPFLRALARKGNHPNDWFTMLGSEVKDWFGSFRDSQVELKMISESLKRSPVNADFLNLPILFEDFPRNDEIYLNITAFLNCLKEADSCFWYSANIDLIQLVDSYIDDPETALKRPRYRMVEVIDTHFNRMRQLLVDVRDRKKKATVDEIIQGFDHLLDVPVKPTLYKFLPMVRDVSKRLGKNVDYFVKGSELTLNRDRLYLLSDALVHMLRNSLDHGIESPEERKKSGKKETGLLEIECSEKDSGDSIIVIRDDGKGINANLLAEKAMSKNLLTKEKVQQMSEREKLDLIFLPNFSTKEDVTELSGRGVGMDIVKSNIEKLGGSLEIKTELGRGTEFIIQLSERKTENRSQPHA